MIKSALVLFLSGKSTLHRAREVLTSVGSRRELLFKRVGDGLRPLLLPSLVFGLCCFIPGARSQIRDAISVV